MSLTVDFIIDTRCGTYILPDAKRDNDDVGQFDLALLQIPIEAAQR